MNYALLEFEDYERAPTEPHLKFAVLEQAARRRMNEIMDSTQSGNLSSELRTQYSTLMIAMASALGIPGVTYPDGRFENEWDEHQAFCLKVQGVVAKIMLDSRLISSGHSVLLATSTKAKIEGQVSILRSMIENSDIDGKRRKKLIIQLDEFCSQLNAPRLNYAAVAVIATAFLAGIQGVTGTLADAPSAYKTIGTILKWIGQDKEAEDKERERLGVLPQPLLTHQKSAAEPSSKGQAATGFQDDWDDDVPF